MLGGFLAVAYVAVGLGFGIWSEDWDSETSRAVWLVITLGAPLLLGAGLWLQARLGRAERPPC